MFVIILIIGQSIIYINNPYHCEYTAIYEDGRIDVHIDTNYSLSYTVCALQSDSQTNIRSYAVYYDPEYPVTGNRADVEDCIKRLQLCFSNNNTDLPIINTVSLTEIINNTDTTIAIVFATGTLPEEIYNGQDTSSICNWLKNGGTMYWINGKLGHTYSVKNGDIYDVPESDKLFFGTDEVINPASNHVFTKNLVEGSFTDILGIYYGETTNGLNCSKLTEPYLALDYNDGTYSAVTLVKYPGGTGTIGVFGGNIKYEAVPTSAMASVAQTIVSKISYDTILIDWATSSGCAELELNGNERTFVFMYVGEVNSIWGKIMVPSRI